MPTLWSGLAMMSQTILILTHAFFMGRAIISPKGARREIKLSKNIYILNG
jgi:hypothetical protein